MTESSIQSRKQAAVDFLRLVVAGRIDQAYGKYIDMRGKHHNPFFPAGFPALQKGMKENHEQFPNKQIIPKNVLGDGDLVVVHSHLIMNHGESGMSVVHVFRFQADKVVELWDCGQAIPADSPNKDGAF
jgi:predicted SnoaL-like aldol condensation-catalyzing enzyme